MMKTLVLVAASSIRSVSGTWWRNPSPAELPRFHRKYLMNNFQKLFLDCLHHLHDICVCINSWNGDQYSACSTSYCESSVLMSSLINFMLCRQQMEVWRKIPGWTWLRRSALLGSLSSTFSGFKIVFLKILNTVVYFRFAGAPKKCQFVIDTLNIIDVLSILPFFVSLFFESDLKSDLFGSPDSSLNNSTSSSAESDSGAGSFEDILQIFRIFKLARVLKLARHSPGLQVLMIDDWLIIMKLFNDYYCRQ